MLPLIIKEYERSARPSDYSPSPPHLSEAVTRRVQTLVCDELLFFLRVLHFNLALLN